MIARKRRDKSGKRLAAALSRGIVGAHGPGPAGGYATASSWGMLNILNSGSDR